jgi:hypothetical protein
MRLFQQLFGRERGSAFVFVADYAMIAETDTAIGTSEFVGI